MYVEVILGGHGAPVAPVALREPDDFTAFKVVVEGVGAWDDLARALEGTGHVDAPNAWIDRDALGGLGRRDDPAWVEQLDGMVAYARGRQWVDDHGCVRAHCEWVAGDPKP